MRSAKNDAILFFVLLVLSVGGLVGIWQWRLADKEVDVSLPPPPVARVPSNSSPTLAPTSTVTQEEPVYERPPGMVCDKTNSICLNTSYENRLLTSPFSVTGTWRGEASAYVDLELQLVDASGTELLVANPELESATTTNRSFAVRDFLLTVPSSTNGFLRIHRWQEQTGRKTLEIPVRFPTKEMRVSIHKMGLAYELENDGYACPDIPLKLNNINQLSIVETKFPIEAALRAALRMVGYSGLRDFSVRAGVATVTFDAEANGADPACTARQHLASIEATLKQFSSVKEVKFIWQNKLEQAP